MLTAATRLLPVHPRATFVLPGPIVWRLRTFSEVCLCLLTGCFATQAIILGCAFALAAYSIPTSDIPQSRCEIRQDLEVWSLKIA